jgi:hypothetical protein
MSLCFTATLDQVSWLLLQNPSLGMGAKKCRNKQKGISEAFIVKGDLAVPPTPWRACN